MAALKSWLSGLAPFLRDLHVYAGGLLLALGLGLWWPPAALIAFGVVLIARGVWRMP